MTWETLERQVIEAGTLTTYYALCLCSCHQNLLVKVIAFLVKVIAFPAGPAFYRIRLDRVVVTICTESFSA